MNITEKTHVRLTLATFGTGLVFAVGVMITAFQWYGDERQRQQDIESRLSSLEGQTKTQWQRINDLAAIKDKVGRIDERTATIMDLLKE